MLKWAPSLCGATEMFISTFKSGKDKRNEYVRLLEAYRDENGKSKVRVVRNFGRLDKLLAANPNALNELRAKYASESAEKKSAVASERLETVAKLLADTGAENLSAVPCPSLNYGWYALKTLWDDVLFLSRKFNYIAKAKTRRQYGLNAAVSYLTFMKVMNPGSVLGHFCAKDGFLGDPVRDVSIDNLYDAYTVLDQNRDDIFKWINKKMDGYAGKDRATLVFYDVTNCYFETSLTDAERDFERDDFLENVRSLAREARANGTLSPEYFDESGEPVIDALPPEFWDTVADEKIQYLRMRGPSKEHRFDLPIVSVVLVIDRFGNPMDFAVYAGNASEFKTMGPTIGELRKKYNVQGSILVADRGLNSLDNLKMLGEHSMGFLAAQKVTQFDSQTERLMFDLDGYTPVDPDCPEKACFRTVEHWKKRGKGGEEMDCTLVLTYDQKRRDRDEAILKAWVDIVKKKQAAGVKIGPSKSGWAALAKTEKGAEQKILGVDEAVLAKKRKYCGFAAVVYRAAPEEEARPASGCMDLKDAEIPSTYRRLGRIEECFRILKSNIGLRPMFVYTVGHIRAHIAVCVLALLLIRLLQQRLKARGVHLSATQIQQTLRDASVTVLTPGDVPYFINTAERSELRRGRLHMKTEEIAQLLKDGKVACSYQSDVMKACDLEPLPNVSNLAEIARCLKTRFSSAEQAIPELQRA